MFWRKKKEAEEQKRVFLPPPPSFIEVNTKTEYKTMNQVIFDAEKYEYRNQIEVRNALLIELKNQIDRVLNNHEVNCNSFTDYESNQAIYLRIEAMSEEERQLASKEDISVWKFHKFVIFGQWKDEPSDKDAELESIQERVYKPKPVRITEGLNPPPKRYPMTTDQPSQIDCRRSECMFNKGGGNCANISPAITLNENSKVVCWSESITPTQSKSDQPQPIQEGRTKSNVKKPTSESGQAPPPPPSRIMKEGANPPPPPPMKDRTTDEINR